MKNNILFDRHVIHHIFQYLSSSLITIQIYFAITSLSKLKCSVNIVTAEDRAVEARNQQKTLDELNQQRAIQAQREEYLFDLA